MFLHEERSGSDFFARNASKCVYWCACERVSRWGYLKCLFKDHPLAPHCDHYSRSLEWPCAFGPVVILGGLMFLMSEVPL